MKTTPLLAILFACPLAVSCLAGVEDQVNELIPKLAAESVKDRYGPQIELQDLAVNAARPGAETERVELARILSAKASDAAVPQPARVWIVRQLEHIGREESLEALGALLDGSDAELRECARRALEKNPAPAASESLRAALKKGGEVRWEIGLIAALGERRDAPSVRFIKPYLDKPETVAAAASALAKIASPSAAEALQAAAGAKHRAVLDALVTVADGLAEQGHPRLAKSIYNQLYEAGNPLVVRGAALQGLVKVDRANARDLVSEALLSDQPRLQNAAILAAPEVFGRGATRLLAPLLPKLAPAAKVQVLGLLGPSAEPQIIEVANDEAEVVRLAVLEALGRVGGAASVPVLVKTAAGDAKSERVAAEAALASIRGRGASAEITRLAGEGDAKCRAAAINALAARQARRALPQMIEFAGEKDPVVTKAAYAALRQLGSDRQIPTLGKLLITAKDPDALAALQAVGERAKDKPAAARSLLALRNEADPEGLVMLLDALSVLGGADVLKALSDYASGDDEGLRDAAVRALGNCPDFAAAKPLLSAAKVPNAKLAQNVLAVQGIARLVKAAEREKPQARIEAVLAGMEAARRVEEKRLLLSSLASVVDAQAAVAIKPFLAEPDLRAEAGLAAAQLAAGLARTDRAAARDLAQAVLDADISGDINDTVKRTLGRLNR